MSEALVGAVAALAGSLMMFVLQEVARTRERAATLDHQRRQELAQATARLADRLLGYRAAQLARQHHRLAGLPEDAELSRRVRDARAEAWSAYFTGELLGLDPEVATVALGALSTIRESKRTRTRTRWTGRARLPEGLSTS